MVDLVFKLGAMGTFPHRVNNVVNMDGYYRRPWLLELIGAICTRKFTADLHLVKSINKVPVVVIIHRGNHLQSPFWNFRKKRKVPLHTSMTQILTAEQVKSMSVDEINAAIKEGFEYDDCRYQQETGFKIVEKYRAERLHR